MGMHPGDSLQCQSRSFVACFPDKKEDVAEEMSSRAGQFLCSLFAHVFPMFFPCFTHLATAFIGYAQSVQ